MSDRRKHFFVLVLTLLVASTLHAGLLITGNTAGFFQAVSGSHITATNAPNGIDASFRTGIPWGKSFQSGVGFSGHDFENLESGDTFSLGSFTYYNGLSLIGTSSGSALFDFYLDFKDPAIGRVHLTTITFGIDPTVNRGASLPPDAVTTSFLQPPPIWLGDELVKFTINGLPASTLVAENSLTELGNISVTVLIPESSTFAAIIGAAMFVATLWFRRRVSDGPRVLAG